MTPPGVVAAGTGRVHENPEAAGWRFVVQRHRARRLHYDFRLEIDGVLVSWAVPKGPTLDPAVRRAAFRVEDHGLDYFDFEGVLAAGAYGAGDVVVWDAGTWVAPDPAVQDRPRPALEAGELHIDLAGQKIRGRFALVRTSIQENGKERWLLVHKRDAHAIDGWDPEDHPYSVLSGRTNDEVRLDPDGAWRSGLPEDRTGLPLHRPPATPEEIKALDTLPRSGRWSIFGRELRVTNLDKVLFPARPREDPVTKRDLLRYAAQIAPVVIPYLAGRPLNMHRYPDGPHRPGFWQKELPERAPFWLTRWRNPDAEPDQTQTHLVADEPAAVVWAANLGALEWHAWTSTAAAPHQPTYALIDLDPGEKTSWDDLLVLARLHRTALEHLGLVARAKVTGLRGIQIWLPIAEGPDFQETRSWVEKLSRTVGAAVPGMVSWRWQLRHRDGLARLDYTQNAIDRALVAPYSPRAAPGAPVSAPIEWDELDEPGLRPDGFTIRTVGDRLAAKGDLFSATLGRAQWLPPLL